MIKYIISLLTLALLAGGCAAGSRKAAAPVKSVQPEINRKAYNHYLAGALHDFQNEPEKALLEYYQALLWDSTSAQIHKAIARDLMRLQKYESAVLSLKKSYRLNPQDQETLNYLGEAYYKQGQNRQAIIYFEKLLDENPYNSAVQNNLVFLYTQLKMNDRLLAYYRKMTESYPGDTQRALQYAVASLQNHKMDEARRVLTRLFKQDSTNLYTLYVLGNLHEAEKDTASALRVFRRIIRRNPNYQDALERIFRLYRAQGNWAAIEQIYSPLIVEDSTNLQARLILAESYYLQKKRREARRTLEPVLADQHFRASALELLGRMAFEEDSLEEAENYFTLLTQENTKNRFGWLFLSVIYNRQQKYEKNITLLQQALSLFPKDSDFLNFYGNSLDQVGRSREAIQPLKEAVKNDPDNLSGITTLAALYDKLDLWPQADSLYRMAIQKFPDNPLLLNNYSYSLCLRKIDLMRAKKMAEKALKLAPGNGAYLDTMGWILFHLGQYPEALKYIQKAVAMNEESGEVLEHLGDVYLKLGNPEDARRSWERALQKSPENEQLKEKLQNL